MAIKEPTQWSTGHPVSVGWMKQFRYFLTMFGRISSVPGDVVECGLGEGNTFSMLAYLIGSENMETKRNLWGFDSFEGFPEPDSFVASPRNPKMGEWRFTEESVRSRLQESGILTAFPELMTIITKGFFGTTLPEFPDRPIAFLHIDADLYEGYRDALHHLFPRVVRGGVVLFDEYREFPNRPEYDYGRVEKWPGCTKAVDEYFKGRPERIQYYLDTKKYYVIKV